MLRPVDNPELEKLLGTAKIVPGTYPPVFIFEGGLIGYDKAEQMRVIAWTRREPVKNSGQRKRLGLNSADRAKRR